MSAPLITGLAGSGIRVAACLPAHGMTDLIAD
jgi:hypothetical protein